MRLRWILPLAAGAALAPVWVMAPPPTRADGPDTVEGLIERCRATGLAGAALADEAIARVARAYPTHSLWHLGEPPGRSLAAHRGWSHQYNTVLLLVLRGLGFEARLVHAARVRGFGHVKVRNLAGVKRAERELALQLGIEAATSAAVQHALDEMKGAGMLKGIPVVVAK